MKLLFATTNQSKAREIEQVLAPLGVDLRFLTDVSAHVAEPVEDADTFEGNARLKAVAYAQALNLPCLADDSGLEVDALGGAPGIYSAYYAGTGKTREERDPRNNAKLIAELRALDKLGSAARFVCALCLTDSDGHVLFETRGTMEGVIIEAPRGTNGFGYDPYLLLPDLAKTSAELAPAEKNARSHRGKAARALHEWLTENPVLLSEGA